MRILVFVTSLLLIYWLAEALAHYFYLFKIEKRILVTGTRGKSSVCRLIAAGLNGGGIRAIAKTTGSATRIIMPDGSEQALARSGNATILEQCRVVKLAVANKANALVIESMALRPQLQWVEAQRIIKPSILVITNVGPDHLDVSGESLPEIAKTFCQAIPYKGVLFTREQNNLAVLQKRAQYMDCQVQAIAEPDPAAGIDYGEWSYIEHPENIELALAVCEHIGVNRETALAGMRKANPDIGALREIEASLNGQKVKFINGFAANDPESTQKLFDRYQEAITGNRFILILNLRDDRPHRSLQLLELVKSQPRAALTILCGGDNRLLIKNKLQKHGFPAGSLVDFHKPAQVIAYLESTMHDGDLVMGIGNITGAGIKLVNYFLSKGQTGAKGVELTV
ncbi:MAG TPA: poly-gamma-glutamate synthase PgsB [bacterium]|nr:poly-gamma-glutamate synthase PgsB [bacterium]HPN45927.1 poly-gamma-glutamate synthase PgsB [bacterium]